MMVNYVSDYESSVGIAMINFLGDFFAYPLIFAYLGENYLVGLFYITIMVCGRNICFIVASLQTQLTFRESVEVRGGSVFVWVKPVYGYFGAAILTVAIECMVLWFLARFPADPRPSFYLPVTILWVIGKCLIFIVLPFLRYGFEINFFGWTPLMRVRDWLMRFGLVRGIAYYFGGQTFYDLLLNLITFALYIMLIYCCRFCWEGFDTVPRT